MDWETDRRTHDAGIIRATREHGLTFGPASLKRLDDLDSRIAGATAEIACLRQKLRQPDEAIAAELKFEGRQLQQAARAAAECQAAAATEEDWHAPEVPTDNWPWWHVTVPPAVPEITDSPPQRRRYPGGEGAVAARDLDLATDCEVTLRPAPPSAPSASADPLRRRHLEHRRVRRGNYLEVQTKVGKTHFEQDERQRRAREATSLPVGEQPPAPIDDATEEDDYRSAPPLPDFIQGHPSRLAGSLRAGFKLASMRHANPGFGPPAVLQSNVGGPEFLGLRLSRGPTELEWTAHCDRESVSQAFVGILHSARSSEGVAQ